MVKRGITLVEVLVAMGVGLLVLGIVLTFHMLALHMAARQQRISANYRRVVEVLDRVETLLGNADVYRVDATDIIFARDDETNPVQKRFPVRDPALYTLCLQGPTLVLRHGGTSQTILTLEPWEQMSFAMYQDEDYNATKRYLDIIATGNPPVRTAQEGQQEPFSLVRRVYIEPQY